MLDIMNLRKSFNSLSVLKGINIHVEKGDVIAILGPSGSGKTTMLRCMNLLETADEGAMVFDGELFHLNHITKKEIAKIRKKTAFVFQNYNLFRNKTALENITQGLIYGHKIPKKQAMELGRIVLEKVGLQDHYDYYPSQLSGGQQQRVGIARALAANPEIIFFDEPTSALDPELVGEVLAVIRQLAKEGITMLIVTHEINFAKNVSTKVMFMDQGMILETSASKEFFRSPKEDKIKAFLHTISNEV